ncbi:hypothetical protein FA13DRAFT_1802443 [Coprinellus micaceus]|uniref:Uncharacterized protein n=1 Tax=Coprinellus micaceus TaxID=71717 RepID=A0A4Y7SC61_COPMI|nr:hypothetical protein FA13DRAFT_1802443 [Coprinellus micaceus]
MEYLSDDWVTLNEFKDRARDSGAFQPFLTEIRTVLNQIVDVLEANRLVHGDLRLTNVVIRVEEDGRRNTVDIEWPKPEGGGDDMLIGKNDDRKMVNIWWNSETNLSGHGTDSSSRTSGQNGTFMKGFLAATQGRSKKNKTATAAYGHT